VFEQSRNCQTCTTKYAAHEYQGGNTGSRFFEKAFVSNSFDSDKHTHARAHARTHARTHTHTHGKMLDVVLMLVPLINVALFVPN